MRPAPSWSGLARAGLAAAGVAAIAWLVRSAGMGGVARAVAGAGPWLPWIALGEFAAIASDVVALRLILGERGVAVPGGVWLRSAMSAYAAMVFLPSGRGVGEIARAAMLGPHVGVARAVAAGTSLQGLFLWANAIVCIPCWLAVASVAGPSSALAGLLAANALIAAVVSVALLRGLRHATIGAWLGRRVSRLAAHGPQFDAALRELPAPPVGAYVAAALGRLGQVVQAGALLAAVGVPVGVVPSLVCEAIHLVASGAGDLIPGQLGVSEASYRLFAAHLGLTHAAAAAVAIALVHRTCKVVLGSVCAVGAAMPSVGATSRTSSCATTPAASGRIRSR